MSDQTVIKVKINGKFYPISCEVGEESRVKESADLLTEIINSIDNSDNKVSESKILLMSALILADKNIRNSNENKTEVENENLNIDEILSWLEKVNIKFNNIARLIDNS